MPRPDKVAAVDEVKSGLSGSAATLLTDYRGLSVTELAELRAELRKNNAAYKVVKNTLTRLAASEAGIEGLESYLVGPTALVFCEDDPVGPAKVLRAFAKDHPELLIKAGYVDGQLLDEAAAVRLADLESREELLARLAGLMDGALSGFARLMQAALVDMGRAMKALEEDGGVEAKGFSPEPAEPAAEAAEPEVATDEAPEPEDAAAEAATAGPEAATDEPREPEAATDEPEAATDEDATDDASVVEQATEAAVDTVAGVTGAAAGVAASAASAVADGAEAVADGVEAVADALGGTSDEDRTDEDTPDAADDAAEDQQ